MVNMEELSPELQEAVKEYRKYGQEVFGLDRRIQKHGLDEDQWNCGIEMVFAVQGLAPLSKRSKTGTMRHERFCP
jgi:hypothetical protein